MLLVPAESLQSHCKAACCSIFQNKIYIVFHELKILSISSTEVWTILKQIVILIGSHPSNVTEILSDWLLLTTSNKANKLAFFFFTLCNWVKEIHLIKTIKEGFPEPHWIRKPSKIINGIIWENIQSNAGPMPRRITQWSFLYRSKREFITCWPIMFTHWLNITLQIFSKIIPLILLKPLLGTSMIV